MRIGFIGSGKVATAFGLYLRDKNQNVAGYYSRSAASANTAAQCVQTETFQSVAALVRHCDWIGITTPDDQIETVAAEISLMDLPTAKVFFHMSGAKSSECLYPLKAKGHQCLSLHPLQTIAESIAGAKLLGQCLYTAEGDQSQDIQRFLDALERPVVWITAAQKPYYHAAACVASNYLYTLAQEAVSLMALAGFSETQGYEALKPLMLGTLENLSQMPAASALTGPIARGDVETVSQHIHALSEHDALLRVYKEMGLATLQLASLEKLKDSKKREALESLLKVEEQANEI